MIQRFYCPECGDYSSDREYPKTADGFQDTPVCKSCGTDCSRLSEDPRMTTLSKLADEMIYARATYQKKITAVTKLTNELKTDWGLMKLP